jgi:hypothetical protein
LVNNQGRGSTDVLRHVFSGSVKVARLAVNQYVSVRVRIREPTFYTEGKLIEVSGLFAKQIERASVCEAGSLPSANFDSSPNQLRMKLTKVQTKLHDEAIALLKHSRDLTESEVAFVLDNYHPGAETNLGKNGVFFTPEGMATDLSVFAYPTGDRGNLRYIDACAGIGRLIWAIKNADGLERKISEIVAVEQNPRFVEIGRKLFPDVNWIEGSIFNLDLVRQLGWFTIGVSNPPFGRLPDTLGERKWLANQQPAHLAVAEVLSHLCERGAVMIIPDNDHSEARNSKDYANFTRTVPGMTITPESVDSSIYKFASASPSVAVVNLEYQGEKRNPHYHNLLMQTDTLQRERSVCGEALAA